MAAYLDRVHKNPSADLLKNIAKKSPHENARIAIDDKNNLWAADGSQFLHTDLGEGKAHENIGAHKIIGYVTHHNGDYIIGAWDKGTQLTKPSDHPKLDKLYNSGFINGTEDKSNFQKFANGGTVDLSKYQEQTPFGLYSHAAETAAALPQAKGTPDQLKAMLMKQGVKPAEIEHSNYDDVFAGRPSVTKDELVQHFRQSMPSINEALLSKAPKYANYAVAPSRYHTYTLPGAENYREVLLKTKSEAGEHEANATKALEAKQEASRRYDRAEPGSPEAKAALQDLRAAELLYRQHLDKYLKTKDDVYQHGHWPGQKNVLAHLRMADRWGPNNEKILHIEELQSDWGQEARESGMRDPRNPTEDDDTMVPHHPYVKHTGAWTDLALKKVLHEAAHGGYDKVVFTPGEEQAARFDLSNHLSRIVAMPTNEGTIHLDLHNHEDPENPFETVRNITPEELPKHVGKELAERIMKEIKFPEKQRAWRIESNDGRFKSGSSKNFEAVQSFLEGYPEHIKQKMHIAPIDVMGGAREADLSGLDLKVGGEGMKGFYDKILPEQLNALVKKHDPQVRMRRDTIETPAGTHPVHALDITPKLRESILRGQKAFAAGGEVDEPEGITAYHGSPHDFEQFDISKIGTGEGAQAYGHGLYFAQAEPTAREYRDTLTDRASNFRVGNIDMPKWILRGIEMAPDRSAAIAKHREEFEKRLAEAEAEEQSSHQPWLASGQKSAIKDVLAGLDALERGAELPHTRGRMYEVHIAAHPDHFLDWDKPIYQQTEHVQNAVRNALSFAAEQGISGKKSLAGRTANSSGNMVDADPDEFLQHDGASIQFMLQRVLGAKGASDALHANGVKGIKYLDANSRTPPPNLDPDHVARQIERNRAMAAQVTDEAHRADLDDDHQILLDRLEKAKKAVKRNYVVFDDKLVGVRRKYARGGVVNV